MAGESGNSWAVVLAGGAGTRLASLTRGGDGAVVPKQYCSLRGGPTLLAETLRRARRLVGRERVLVVVAAEHRRYWQEELRELSAEQVVVQPAARGTAAGILLPVMTLLELDPEARLALFPADHHVAREHVLQRVLERALGQVATSERERVLLLGIEPDRAEPQYGWILPGMSPAAVAPVATFVEKPQHERALEMRRAGGLWNSFLFAARVRTLLELFERHLPDLAAPFRRTFAARRFARAQTLAELYRSIPARDFCRDLLEPAVEQLGVCRVPACGWTDLGTPERVEECLRRFAGAAPAPLDAWSPPVVLARALERRRAAAT